VHGHGFFHALQETTVAIEEGRDAGENVVVAAVSFLVVDALNVDMGENDEFGIVFAGSEELGM
jgi:hypothetical protein